MDLGVDLAKIENIIWYSTERYFDPITQRMIEVGRHDDRLCPAFFFYNMGYYNKD